LGNRETNGSEAVRASGSGNCAAKPAASTKQVPSDFGALAFTYGLVFGVHKSIADRDGCTETYEQSLSRWLFVSQDAWFGFTSLAESFVLFGVGGANYSRMPLLGMAQWRGIERGRCLP
jgi:hypothetical protein